MRKILIVGDSFSDRCGFDDPLGKVWWSHLGANYTVTNLSANGNSNAKIFMDAVSEVTVHQYDLVIIQWSSLFRLTMHDSKSVYNNTVNFNVNASTDTIYQTFVNEWTRHFLHCRMELLTFLKQVTIAAEFLKLKKIKFLFIKTFDNFLDELVNQDWHHCTEEFKNSVLHYTDHPDYEITQLYSEIQNRYQYMLAVSEANWLNLHKDAWHASSVDLADDLCHPGVEQCKLFGRTVLQSINNIDFVS